MVDAKKKYLFLDGLRCIAMVWVMYHHVRLPFGTLSEGPGWWAAWARVGYMGVDIFFVISGFLITGLLLDHFPRGLDIGRFYTRRFFKIIPSYVLLVAVGFIFSALVMPFRVGFLDSHNPPDQWWGYFFLVQNFTGCLTVLGHTWSLAVEEHFYLIYPWLIALVVALVPEEERHGALLRSVVVLILFGNLLRYLLLEGLLGFDYNPLAAIGGSGTTFFRFDALLAGCLVKLTEHFWLRFCGRSWAVPVFFGAAGIYLFSYLVEFGFNTHTWFHYTLAYLGAAMIIIACLGGAKPLLWVLEQPLLRWVGRNSYGIYVWHYPWLFFLSKFWPGVDTAFIIFFMLSSIAIGWLSTVTVERYFLNLRAKVAP